MMDLWVPQKKVMRLARGKMDDLKILIAKKFVIPLETGVRVIKTVESVRT